MATGSGGWACDTSVAIAALDPNHQAHKICRKVVREHKPALAGHAAFEAYAVLTRLPPPLRLTGPQGADVLKRAFPEECWIEPGALSALRSLMAARRVVGGAVYDALVGYAALSNSRVLLTRDRRAERTYKVLEVEYQLI